MLLGTCAALLTFCIWCFLRTGLYLFDVGHANKPADAWVQLRPSACLAVPDVLLHVPLKQQQQDSSPEQQQQLSGLLVVGSKCSSSQVLGLPQALWDTSVDVWSAQPDTQLLPTLQSALEPSVTGAQAVAVYKDPTGEGRCRTSDSAKM